MELIKTLHTAVFGAKLYENHEADNNALYEALSLENSEPGKAQEICLKLANQGNVEAQYKFGMMYLNTDSVIALDHIKSAAWQGHPQAKNQLGVIYKEGKYVECVDYAKAFNYFTEVAETIPNAKCNLGLMHRFGLGVDIDFKKAFNCFDEAKDSDLLALNYLGEMYFLGLGVEENIPKAFKCFKEAANLGNPTALGNLGAMLMFCEAVNVDEKFELGLTYLMKAASQDEPAALRFLGELYEKGNPEKNVERDEKLAEFYFFKAAELGNSGAMFWLGMRYERDKERSGTMMELPGHKKVYNAYPIGISQSMPYFIKAAELGNSAANCYLGIKYLYGTGVEQDIPLAAQYLLTAAKLGNKSAALPLLRIVEQYTFGYMGKRNYSFASTCCVAAARLGEKSAIYKLPELYKMIRVHNELSYTDHTQPIINYLEEAHTAGNLDATFNSGLCTMNLDIVFRPKLSSHAEIGTYNLILGSLFSYKRVLAAAEGGISEANEYLGDYCQNLLSVNGNNYYEAIKFYSAATAIPKVHKKLAEMYRDGCWIGFVEVIKPDFENAIKYYKSAAENGSVPKLKAEREINKMLQNSSDEIELKEMKEVDELLF